MMCHSLYSPSQSTLHCPQGYFSLLGFSQHRQPLEVLGQEQDPCGHCSHADTTLTKAVSCTARMNKPKEGIKP